MNHAKTVLLGAGVLLLLGAGARADTQVLCAITESVECSANVPCGPPEFDGVVPPTFLHVDLARKVVTLLAPEVRRGEVTPIDAVRETDDGWVASGLENERAWSLYLTRDGHMTLTVTMDGTTWTAFGHCMPAAHASP